MIRRKEVFRDTGVNAFVGPNASLLVKVGAKFVPVGFIYLFIYLFQCNTESLLVLFLIIIILSQVFMYFMAVIVD